MRRFAARRPANFAVAAATAQLQQRYCTPKGAAQEPTDAKQAAWEKGVPAPGTGAADERVRDEQSRKTYARSVEFFANRTIKLNQSYAGAPEARHISRWTYFWYNYVRFYFTGETLVGRDRWGNLFVRKWFFYRHRNEIRKMYRRDKDKRHQPYGMYPTDSRLWEAWCRGWRHDPPTPEEEEFHREKLRTKMGPHVVGDEEYEDAVVRSFAHTTHAGSLLRELDTDENYNKFLNHYDRRLRENNPQKEASTWTSGFVRGDIFYNEEEVETMRTNIGHIFRDREWQTLEMKRQTRHRKQPYTVRMPDDPSDPNSHQGDPVHHFYDRTDCGVPLDTGVEQLTTPELERLRTECDVLEEERIKLRKELGLTDVGDFRDGREPVEKGYDPYQPPPVSERWRPKCWQESWGTGGGNWYG